MPSILVVDDSSEILRMLLSAFSRIGYEVATAADGESAIELCSGHCFDVVLSDMQMPRMTGCELARWIVTHCPATRMLLMSGHAHGCDECPYSPRCAVLRKPFRPRDAITLVQQVIGRA